MSVGLSSEEIPVEMHQEHGTVIPFDAFQVYSRNFGETAVGVRIEFYVGRISVGTHIAHQRNVRLHEHGPVIWRYQKNCYVSRGRRREECENYY